MLERLKKSILEDDPVRIVSEFVLERVPFIFGEDWEQFRTWRRELSTGLQIDPCEVHLCGSACVGFSFSPDNPLKAFSERSDIDVSIISERFFSSAWNALREINPATARISARQRHALLDHQRRYVYAGCIATDRLLAILPFGAEWMASLARMADRSPTVGRTINARIYKDFAALRSYQVKSIRMVRQELLTR